ncbi:PHD finger-like domain-containing protein 5A [Cricetulus griseus]|uniref:PHD finger-like domain-containing protein 5A n=1 Tax=Cricetulus griseus TaxID=10029 RepID=G3I5G6_CRIGR|nr:PHD finger-like domain-containing protein 5A [Cricetulus griseus]
MLLLEELCENCDGKCVICDSYVRPCTLVRICDECNSGSYQGRCVICGGPGVSDAYYCKECTIQEKIEMVAQRLSIWGALRQTCSMNAKNTASRRGDGWAVPSSPIKLLQMPEKTPTTTSRKGPEPIVSPEQPARASVLAPCPCLSPTILVGMEERSSQSTLAEWKKNC